MIRPFLMTVATMALLGLAVAPSSAHQQNCQNRSTPSWYAFAAATGSKKQALNAARKLGRTKVQDLRRTNSPSHHKNLWLVYRGPFNSNAQSSGDLRYLKTHGYEDAYVKQLCMW